MELSSQSELMSIDNAGKAEVRSCLNPEDANLGQYLVDGCSHRIDTDEGTDAEGAWEEPRHTLPCSRDT